MDNIITDKCLKVEVLGYHEDDHPGLRGWKVEQVVYMTAPEFLYHCNNLEEGEESLRAYDKFDKSLREDDLKKIVAQALGITC